MSINPDDDLRAEAKRRVTERHDFPAHLLVYLLVNALLVVVWATTGGGFFWPGFVIGGWGVGLVMHAWSVYLRRPVTPAEVDWEMERLRQGSRASRG